MTPLRNLLRSAGTQGLPAILLVICCIAIGSGVYWWNSTRSYSAYSDTDPTFNRSYWTHEIRVRGASTTYKEFVSRTTDAPVTRQHFSAHVFGELLAQERGLGGVTVCDASFGFGCFHGLFGTILAERGTSVISMLDSTCVRTVGPRGAGCQHGIGHGILEYLGYGHLSEALELCRMTTTLGPLFGCVPGVFMEYNTRLTDSPDGLVPRSRPYNPKDPYDPCTHVASEYWPACYYELGLWASTDKTLAREKIERFCSGANATGSPYCFFGIGDSAIYDANYSIESAVERCTHFSAQGELGCRAGVSWGFYLYSQNAEEAREACRYTDPARESACESLADIAHINTP